MTPTKLLSRATHLLRAGRYGEHVRPLRDWFILVSIVGILLLVSGVWSYVVYYQFTNETDIKTMATPLKVNTASLTTVRTVFEKRAVERAHYLSDYHFVDPSR